MHESCVADNLATDRDLKYGHGLPLLAIIWKKLAPS